MQAGMRCQQQQTAVDSQHCAHSLKALSQLEKLLNMCSQNNNNNVLGMSKGMAQWQIDLLPLWQSIIIYYLNSFHIILQLPMKHAQNCAKYAKTLAQFTHPPLVQNRF